MSGGRADSARAGTENALCELDLAAFLDVTREGEHGEGWKDARVSPSWRMGQVCGRTFLLTAVLAVGERCNARGVLSPVVQYTVGILPVAACPTRFLVETIKGFLRIT